MVLPKVAFAIFCAAPRVLILEVAAPGELVPAARISDLEAAINGETESIRLRTRPLDPEPPTADDVNAAVSVIAGLARPCPRLTPDAAVSLDNALSVLHRDPGGVVRDDAQVTRALLRGLACKVDSASAESNLAFQMPSPEAQSAIAELVGTFPELGGEYSFPPEELNLIVWALFLKAQRGLGTSSLTVSASTPVPVFFDGHLVGSAPISLGRIVPGKHFVQLRPVGATGERVLIVDFPAAQEVRVDARALLVDQRLSNDEAPSRLEYPSRKSRDEDAVADADHLSPRQPWLTIHQDGDNVVLKAGDANRKTTEVSCAPARATEVGVALVSSLRDQPQALLSPALGRVPLIIEDAGGQPQFVVLSEMGKTPEGPPLPVPSTLYVVPGKILLSANPGEVPSYPIAVQVPTSGATVRLKPAGTTRIRIGALTAGIGVAGLVGSLGVLAVLEGLGQAIPKSAGGGPGGARRVIGSDATIPIVMVSSAGVVALGLVLALTADSGVKALTPLQ